LDSSLLTEITTLAAFSKRVSSCLNELSSTYLLNSSLSISSLFLNISSRHSLSFSNLEVYSSIFLASSTIWILFLVSSALSFFNC